MAIKVAVIGASGFTGEKLVEILLKHPGVTLSYISAKLEKEIKFSQLFPRFQNKFDLVCKNLDTEEAVALADIIFLALPHKLSFEIAPFFLKRNKRVIDLSADYRLKNTSLYEMFYQTQHKDTENLKTAVYGLPEFYRLNIKKAALIANPGCYPTVSILSIAPLLKENIIEDIIIDAKSGITGAGRHPGLEYHFAHLSGNLFSYKPFKHQHLPEITQILSEIAQKKIDLRFTPHVIPAERGILITVYANVSKSLSIDEINSLYERMYGNEPFIRFYKQHLPQLKDVLETNFCDIGVQLEDNNIVVVGAIDNLIKGASGQAVQNMNIMLGIDEKTGLF